MALLILLSTVFTQVSLSWKVYPAYDLVLRSVEIRETLYLATTGGVVAYSLLDDSVTDEWSTDRGIPVIPILDITYTESEEGPILWGADPGFGLVYKVSGSPSFSAYPQEILHFDVARETRALAPYGDTLFLGSNEGILVLDTRGTASVNDDKVIFLDSGPDQEVYSLGAFRDSLYAGTSQGLYVAPLYDLTQWRSLGTEQGLLSDLVFSVEEGSGYVAVGTDEGLVLLEEDTMELMMEGASVRSLYFYGDTLYIACLERSANQKGGVFALLPDGNLLGLGRKFDVLNLWSLNAWWVFRDTEGRIWASFGWRNAGKKVSEGVGIYNWQEDEWERMRFGEIPLNFIDAVAPGTRGAVWVSLFLSEPYLLPFLGIGPEGELIKPSGFYPADPESPVAVKTVSSIAVTREGDLLVGTLNSGAIHKFSSEGEYIKTIYASSNWVKDVMIDSKGRLVAAVINWGIERCYPDDSPLNWEVLYLASGNFDPLKLQEAPNGDLLIGTGTNIIVIDKDNEISFITQEDGLPEPPVHSLFFDDTGLWAGTASGLAHLSGYQVDKVYLPRERILGVVSEGGRVWALTEDRLALIDAEGLVTWFDQPSSPLTHGLTMTDTTHYFSLEVDSLGNVWVATDFGLNRISVSRPTLSSDTLFIYPNPLNLNETNRLFLLAVPEGSEVALYTLSGEKVRRDLYEVEYSKEEKMATLTFSDSNQLSPGLYLISVTSEEKSNILKFAILR